MTGELAPIQREMRAAGYFLRAGQGYAGLAAYRLRIVQRLAGELAERLEATATAEEAAMRAAMEAAEDARARRAADPAWRARVAAALANPVEPVRMLGNVE
jgi:hypothetical protein